MAGRNILGSVSGFRRFGMRVTDATTTLLALPGAALATVLLATCGGETAAGPGDTTYSKDLAWTTQRNTPRPHELYAVWGRSSVDIFAVGSTIVHFDGSLWSTQVALSSTAYLHGVWGTSATDVFAVGAHGTILHYDGTAWTPQNSGTDSLLNGVWGSSGTDVYAFGSGGTGLHYNGMRWSPVTTAVTQRDWKSTRLNSSHPSISYDVCCMKH